MMNDFVFRNVLHRPIRTIVSVIAVAVEVALVVLIVGLTSGLLQETAKRIEGIGADIMVQPPVRFRFLGFSGVAHADQDWRQIAPNSGTYRQLLPPCCNSVPPAGM